MPPHSSKSPPHLQLTLTLWHSGASNRLTQPTVRVNWGLFAHTGWNLGCITQRHQYHISTLSTWITKCELQKLAMTLALLPSFTDPDSNLVPNSHSVLRFPLDESNVDPVLALQSFFSGSPAWTHLQLLARLFTVLTKEIQKEVWQSPLSFFSPFPFLTSINVSAKMYCGTDLSLIYSIHHGHCPCSQC